MSTEHLISYTTHRHCGQHLLLLAEKAIYWQEEKMLLLADLHLGKAGHFRRAGIAVPGHIHHQDLERLSGLIDKTGAEKVIFLGDLFHSELNNGWFEFTAWMELYPDRKFILVKGNHDIFPPEVYKESRMEIHEQELVVSPFLLTHEPLAVKYQKEGLYNISGHIHPAVLLRGGGMQHITLPCFYFGLHYALLPAFGKFTGFSKIKPKKEEAVFAIAENRVLRL